MMQNPSPYLYTNGNPVNRIDPTGLTSINHDPGGYSDYVAVYTSEIEIIQVMSALQEGYNFNMANDVWVNNGGDYLYINKEVATVTENSKALVEESFNASTWHDPSARGIGNNVMYNYGSYFEIWSGGTRAWRNNNPGNIRPTSFSKKNGSIGKAGGFAVFPNYQKGFGALKILLQTITYSKLTVNEAIERYAPFEENDTKAYQEFISSTTGLSPNMKLNDLNSYQINSIAQAIQKIEGYRSGTIGRYWLGP